MRVLITGAAGYIGGTLVRVLLESGTVAGQVISVLALVDRIAVPAADARVVTIEGNLTDPTVQDSIAAFVPDVVFHLASVPGGAAEQDYALGRDVNLHATLALFERLAAMPGPKAPVVVYASSIAVYGSELPALVTPETPLRPPLTYGAHKLVCEILLADFSRRGQLDGRSLRLPGIVARESSGPGLASAFMSDLLRKLAAGESYVCPVSPEATAWWMSARRCAENLVFAAGLDLRCTDARRAWPLPVLRLSIQQVVDALAARHGEDRRGMVTYRPQPRLEAVFGRYPVLDDADSRALGLRDDGTPAELVERALDT
jgi:D-erythronate 2-dehydrogenase